MPKTKGVEIATPKSVEITLDILSNEELQNELRTLKDVFTASYGPTGRLNLIQNVTGGHVTVSTNSGRVLNSITSASSPITQLLVQAVKGHLNNFNDGGLFTGLLTLQLIDLSLKSSIPRHTAIQINEHALDLILDYLHTGSSPCKIQADIGNMQQMLCVIKSILGSKCATGMKYHEVESLSTLLLRGFLMSCVPNSGMENKAIVLENLRIHACEGPSTSESSLVKGILLDARNIPATNLFHEHKNHDVKVALFDLSLAGNVEDSWFVGTHTELGNTTADIEDNVLESMMRMVDKLIENGVKLVACQKVIHPTLQRYLTKKGSYFIERLSICHIEAVKKLTGARLLSSFQGEIDFGSFGSLARIEPMVVHKNRFLHLIPHETSHQISTLMLCAPDETALDELQLVCSAVLSALKQLVYNPLVVPGGGCFETHLACFLIQNALHNKSLQDLGCSEGEYRNALKSVANAFFNIARSIDHDKYDHLVDTKMFHHWISQPLTSLHHTRTPRNCLCGLVTSDQNTEWCMTEELYSEPLECTDEQSSTTCKLGTGYKNATLDVLSMKITGIKTAFETANIILRVKHFVKEIV